MKATSGVTWGSLRWKLWLTAKLKVTQECSKCIQGQPSRMLAPFLFFSSQTRDSSRIMQSLSFHFLYLFSTCWLDWACFLDKTVYKKQIKSITWFPWERSMALAYQGLKVFVWWCDSEKSSDIFLRTAFLVSVTEMLYKTSLHERRSALWNGTSLHEMIHDWKPQHVPLMDPREGISLINSFM